MHWQGARALAAAAFALLFCLQELLVPYLSELVQGNQSDSVKREEEEEEEGGGDSRYLVRVQHVPESAVEYILHLLLESVVAPRTIFGHPDLPVISTSQKHMCKQFGGRGTSLREWNSGA